MRLIDMHCDTIGKMLDRGEHDLRQADYAVDLMKMKQADSLAQFFACFVYAGRFEEKNRWEEAYKQALHMISLGKNAFSKNEDMIALATNYDEIMANKAAGKMSAILTVEEGGVIAGKMEYLEELYRQGVRLITLTWNFENCLGYPNSKNADIMQSGLKSFGVEAVERMNELGIIVDVSHLSDGGFWDVMNYSKKPVVASHSNARGLCNQTRNLTDDMIRAMAERGGVSGLNFLPEFVHENGNITEEHLVDQIQYLYNVGGEDFVAIGSDFDGFDDEGSTIHHIGQMDKVYNALDRRGFKATQIDKFLSGNVLRVIKENL